jgi:signal transduction histidine kinase/ActR/RegA family two-component response regulator
LERPCFELGEECAVQKVFADGKPHGTIHKHPGKEGQTLYVETKAFPIRDQSGQITSVIETVNNITERYLLQEERLKTQKLESIGTLAGGIAHDFNNLLQGVFGHISMARMSIDQKGKSLVMLERAEEVLHRTVSLTNQLLTFSKGGKPVKKPFPIRTVVENAARFALSGSSSEYEILSQGDLWMVDGDAGQIGQVIQNITLNADQSMPQGGNVTFSLQNITAESEKPAGLEKRECVLISISDDGHGIPQELRERIFDPYFTTKDKGSGLGLATSYSIVRNHGGIIVLEPRPGKGSTFRIYLPAALGKIQEEEPVSVSAKVSSAKVLVMDDEETIREVAGNLLRALGHECEFAERGESAVAMFKAARDEGRPFDLVLLDLTIRGGMGGAETIQKLRTIDPEVKAIVSSGYSDEAVLSDYQNWGFKIFLKKPYQLEDLQRAVDSLLEC